MKGTEDAGGARDALAEALRAPGRPDELAGLGSALAAFQASAAESLDGVAPDAGRDDGAPDSSVGIAAPHRPSYWRKPALTGIVTASLLLAATTAVAENGALPDPVQQVAHHVLGGLGVPRKGHGHPAKPGSVTTSRPTPGSTEATLSNLDLCKTILVDQKGLHSKEVDPTARDRLTAAAGGEDHIVSYCEATLTAAGIGYPPPTPVPTGTERRPSPAPPRGHSTTR